VSALEPTIDVVNGSVLLKTIPGQEVRYTLDGSDPTSDSPVASEAVTVGDGVALKARCFGPGLEPSSVIAFPEMEVESPKKG